MKTEGNKILCSGCGKVVEVGNRFIAREESHPVLDYAEDPEMMFCDIECLRNKMIEQVKSKCFFVKTTPYFVEGFIHTIEHMDGMADRIKKCHADLIERCMSKLPKGVSDGDIELTEHTLSGYSGLLRQVTDSHIRRFGDFRYITEVVFDGTEEDPDIAYSSYVKLLRKLF
jgi:hypothetical protein